MSKKAEKILKRYVGLTDEELDGLAVEAIGEMVERGVLDKHKGKEET